MNILILIFCVWGGYGLGRMTSEFEDRHRKIFQLTKKQLAIAFLKSIFYGPFTKSKLVSKL